METNSKKCQKDYLYSKDSGLTGETPYDYFKRFKAIVNRAVSENYLRQNPSNQVTGVKKPRSSLKKQILTEEELQILAMTPCENDEVKKVAGAQ